jgi:iron complex transport system permease protein
MAGPRRHAGEAAGTPGLGPAGFGVLSLIGAALFLGGLVLALGAGAVNVPPLEVWGALFGDQTEPARTIVLELRGPRALGAAMVGGTLAAIGAALQAVLRNPLADPYVLGVSSGASVGAALAAAFGAITAGALSVSLLAFVGALASVAAVYTIARVGHQAPALRLLLAGIAMSSFSTALTSLILYFVPEATAVRGVMFWLLGGLSGASWASLGTTALLALPALFGLFATSRLQTLLLLGDEAALSLGVDVRGARRLLIGLSALATGAIVAFGGAIGFVGLIVPHALRPYTGPDHQRLLPASVLFGAALLLFMDTIARTVLAPEELPVGILCGLLGAPFFLLLLWRQGRIDD